MKLPPNILPKRVQILVLKKFFATADKELRVGGVKKVLTLVLRRIEAYSSEP